MRDGLSEVPLSQPPSLMKKLRFSKEVGTRMRIWHTVQADFLGPALTLATVQLAGHIEAPGRPHHRGREAVGLDTVQKGSSASWVSGSKTTLRYPKRTLHMCPWQQSQKLSSLRRQSVCAVCWLSPVLCLHYGRSIGYCNPQPAYHY